MAGLPRASVLVEPGSDEASPSGLPIRPPRQPSRATAAAIRREKPNDYEQGGLDRNVVKC